MTLDHERFNAIRNTRKFLDDIYYGRQMFPPSKKDMTRLLYMHLKHYPDEYWIKKLEGIYNKEVYGIPKEEEEGG